MSGENLVIRNRHEILVEDHKIGQLARLNRALHIFLKRQVRAVDRATGYDDRTWLDHFGDPHSDQMHIEERWHRVDSDMLELTLTITDPKIYTKPDIYEAVGQR